MFGVFTSELAPPPIENPGYTVIRGAGRDHNLRQRHCLNLLIKGFIWHIPVFSAVVELAVEGAVSLQHRAAHDP